MFKESTDFIIGQKTIAHKLTHKNLTIHIYKLEMQDFRIFEKFATNENFLLTNLEDSHQKSFPKPLENYLKNLGTELF